LTPKALDDAGDYLFAGFRHRARLHGDEQHQLEFVGDRPAYVVHGDGS
jgi:hypothetical protein